MNVLRLILRVVSIFGRDLYVDIAFNTACECAFWCFAFCCFYLFLAVGRALMGKSERLQLTDALPVDELKLHSFIGPMRGIQGHQNSCYLDATLFAMFGLTSRFDEVIYEKATDETAKGVLDTMCTEIIFPLRRYVQSVALFLYLHVFNISPTLFGCDANPDNVHSYKLFSAYSISNCGVF